MNILTTFSEMYEGILIGPLYVYYLYL